STIRRGLSVANESPNAAGGRMRIRRFVTALAACTNMAMSLAAGDAGATDQAIIDAAKAEGKLVIYTGVERAGAHAPVNAFGKKYPCISAGAVRASSSKIATRLDAEIGADRVQGDVFEFSLLYLTTSLRKRGEILKYDSPDYVHYPAAYADPGYWAATGVSSIIILLNSRKVDEPNLPQSWWDLTKPYWKNKLTIDNLEVSGTGYNWLIAMVSDGRWAGSSSRRWLVTSLSSSAAMPAWPRRSRPANMPLRWRWPTSISRTSARPRHPFRSAGSGRGKACRASHGRPASSSARRIRMRPGFTWTSFCRPKARGSTSN